MRDVDWLKLIRFVGYGPRCRVPILFLGLEEKAREGVENWRARASFQDIEDLYEAHHKKLRPADCKDPFEESNRNPVKQWNMAARWALALEGHREWNDRRIWSAYWRGQLGRRHGNTFLMECFPFPRPNRSTTLSPPWSKKELWIKRRPILRRYLDRYPPRTVIAYGKATKEKVCDLFDVPMGECRKVSGLKNPAFIASNGRTYIAHVGFFGRGYFCSDDIPAIVKALQLLRRKGI